MDEHSEIVQPAALPESITKRREALGLYQLALYGLVGVGAIGVLGMIIVPSLGGVVSDGVTTITAIAVTALAGMVGQQAVKQ